MALSLLALALALAAPAEPPRAFVRVGTVHGALTRPATGTPHVAILYENGDGTNQPMCTEMAKRGFVTLCLAEGVHRGGWESVALEMKAGVEYLRALPGITRVVLYGHSGGGAVASFYQAVAENGVGFCQNPHKLSRCSDALAHLPPADAVLFPDAHPGLAVMDMREINPSLHGDGTRVTVDPALDPYNPANGFNPAGPSHYPPDFIARYTQAQAMEEQRLVAAALRLKMGMASGAITDPAADTLVAYATRTGHLDELDPALPQTTATTRPEKFRRGDGSTVVQPVRSSMVPSLMAVPKSPLEEIRRATMGEFLSHGAIIATDSLTGVDWCSANSATMCNVGAIHVPVYFLASGANNFIGDEERMFDTSPAADKDYLVIEGASHSGTPCVPCEPAPGAFANSARNLFDAMASWINKRF